MNKYEFDWVHKLPFDESKEDYYNSWEQMLAALDRLSIWVESQKAGIKKLRACRFKPGDKIGHENIPLSQHRGEVFAKGTMSPRRTWSLMRKEGIDRAMRKSLKDTSHMGRKPIFSKRQKELWAISYTREQNTNDTSMRSFVSEAAADDDDIVGHERSLVRAIKSVTLVTSRTTVPTKKPNLVCYIIYFFLV
jgi:hypothetical protein